MKVKEPSVAKVQRMVVGERLAYYRQAASAEYWDEVWAGEETRELYERAKKGELGYYEEIFPAYLPQKGRILEAGCGLGQFVIALRARGYEVEGVDYGRQTIEFIHHQFPELPVRLGDVTRLDVRDGFYQGYISLGVMEHRKEGPEPFLREAYRILAPGGMALISVPYLNFLRRIKLKTGVFKGSTQGLDFYQYAYSRKEFDQLLHRAGFEVVAHRQYGGFKGVKDEMPFLSKWFEVPQVGWRLRKFLMNWHWAENHMGHMMVYVCRKAVK